MNIYIPHFTKLTSTIGGGNTFTKNFHKYLPEEFNITSKIPDADIVFVVGSSTAVREELDEAEQNNIPIVLRLDGVPEDWRNRNTGTSRLVEFGERADGIVYQTNFVKETVLEQIKYGREITTNTRLIYNGVDKDIFNAKGIQRDENKYLHVHFRKDPNKRFEQVIHFFRDLHVKQPDVELHLVGRLPSMFKDYNYGFFNGEKVIEHGVLAPNELGGVMRQCTYLVHPAYADPSPNTVLEALHCGLNIIEYPDYAGTGELVEKYEDGFNFGMERCVNEYLKFFTDIINA